VGALLLLNVMTTPHRPSCAPREGSAGEPIHHVEPAVEHRNRQRNPFRWGEGRTLGTTLLPRLLNHRPPIRRGVTWHDLHHQSPQGTVVACCAHGTVRTLSARMSTSRFRDRMHVTPCSGSRLPHGVFSLAT